jgi:hypothetical protein
MDLIKKITRNSAVILIPAAAVSAFLPWENLPFSILISGLLGILNIRALSWSVEGILGTSYANAKMLFFSQFRFVILLICLVVLVYLKLVNVAGIIIGFTIVFLQVLIVGYREARKSRDA